MKRGARVGGGGGSGTAGDNSQIGRGHKVASGARTFNVHMLP